MKYHKPDSPSAMVESVIVSVDNMAGIVYWKATGFYNKHHKYSKQSDLRLQCYIMHNFEKFNLLHSNE
jgi:hypothetical protein